MGGRLSCDATRRRATWPNAATLACAVSPRRWINAQPRRVPVVRASSAAARRSPPVPRRRGAGRPPDDVSWQSPRALTGTLPVGAASSVASLGARCCRRRRRARRRARRKSPRPRCVLTPVGSSGTLTTGRRWQGGTRAPAPAAWQARERVRWGHTPARAHAPPRCMRSDASAPPLPARCVVRRACTPPCRASSAAARARVPHLACVTARGAHVRDVTPAARRSAPPQHPSARGER